MKKNKQCTSQEGFSAVELLITLVMATTVLGSFYQLFALTERLNGAARQKAVASTLAHTGLRRFHSIERPTWFVCNTNSEITTLNPDPPGQISLNEPRPDVALPQPVTTEVLAFAPNGCEINKPIKLISIVRYGNANKEVMHATYIGQ